MQKIVVIGSSDTDRVVAAGKSPFSGETILGGSFRGKTLLNPK